MLATVATIFVFLYPHVMVSSTAAVNSLTVSNASSSSYTLKVMTVVTAIFFPLVLIYQGWTFYVFRRRIRRRRRAGNGSGGQAPAAATPRRGSDRGSLTRCEDARPAAAAHGARGARTALAADVALGLLVTVALLAQATLFAYAVSQAFAGRAPRRGRRRRSSPWPPSPSRAACWRAPSRRPGAAPPRASCRSCAASSCERRTHDAPTAADGAESGEVATAAVQGVDALETYFARYLPAARAGRARAPGGARLDRRASTPSRPSSWPSRCP